MTQPHDDHNLAGKKVLLLAPAYFGYERALEACLASLGADVTFVENRSFRYDPMNKGTRWYEAWFCRKGRYVDELGKFMARAYDLCLFINLFSFHPSLLDALRKHNPNVRCVLYLWDNLKYYRWQPFLQHFDEVFTFDPVEARQYGLNYLANFYLDLDKEARLDEVVDFCFIGSFQSRRFYWLDAVARQLQQQKLTRFFYLYMPRQYNRFVYNKLVYWGTRLFPWRFRGYKTMFDLIFRRQRHADVHHESLGHAEIISRMKQARCVIDLPFSSQTGSTQRVIQALALNKRVLTTNAAVVQEPFYNPDFIRVISWENPVLSPDWGNGGTLPEQAVSHLRIDNWLKRLLLRES